MALELPWPPKQITPNFKRRNHWSSYHMYIKAYKEECCVLAYTVKPRKEFKVTFHPPDKRKRDLDNMIGAFKAGQDGLEMAWGIDDSEFVITYAVGEPVKGGKVVVS